jgi:hypothetical protein
MTLIPATIIAESERFLCIDLLPSGTGIFAVRSTTKAADHLRYDMLTVS